MNEPQNLAEIKTPKLLKILNQRIKKFAPTKAQKQLAKTPGKQTGKVREKTVYFRDSTVSEVYYEVLMIRVLHTARISSVDSLMFGNRIREMVSFVLGKEIEK